MPDFQRLHAIVSRPRRFAGFPVGAAKRPSTLNLDGRQVEFGPVRAGAIYDCFRANPDLAGVGTVTLGLVTPGALDIAGPAPDPDRSVLILKSLIPWRA